MANAFNNFVSSLTKKPATGTSLSSLNTGQTLSSFKQASPISSPVKAPVSTTPNMSIAPQMSIPTNNFFPANSSATSTAKTTIKPPAVTPPVSTAQQNYVAGLSGQQNGGAQPAYDNVTGLLTAYGKSQGLPEVNAPKGGTTAGTTTPVKKEQNAYLDYLKSVFNPDQLAATQKNIDALNQRTADELKFQRGREDELRKNDIGQLTAGQNYQLGENSRLGNKSLADIAIAKGASVDIYNQMLNAGKSVYEAEVAQQQYDDQQAGKEQARLDTIAQQQAELNAPFDLSEGQARYAYNPATGQYDQVAARGKTYAPSSGGGSGSGGSGSGSGQVSSAAQNILQQLNMGANLDDLIKGSSNASQALRNEVLGALNAQGGVTDRQGELFKDAKTAVDKLLSGGYKALGGYSTILGGKYTTAYGDAMAQAQQLQAILARDNLGLLKGAMSDKDLAFIQSMSSGFEGSGIQSEGFIKERLTEIQNKIQKKLDSGTAAVPKQSTASGSTSGKTSSGLSYTVTK